MGIPLIMTNSLECFWMIFFNRRTKFSCFFILSIQVFFLFNWLWIVILFFRFSDFVLFNFPIACSLQRSFTHDDGSAFDLFYSHCLIIDVTIVLIFFWVEKGDLFFFTTLFFEVAWNVRWLLQWQCSTSWLYVRVILNMP